MQLVSGGKMVASVRAGNVTFMDGSIIVGSSLPTNKCKYACDSRENRLHMGECKGKCADQKHELDECAHESSRYSNLF